MAMNKTAMASAIVAKIKTAHPELTGDAETTAKADWELICDALITYIAANAVVTVATGIAVATTGTAAAQTGATTSTGTGAIA